MTPPNETSIWSPTCPLHLAVAFGGVVVDRVHGLVLMREVAGAFGGCSWTPLGKGRPDPGESEVECARREIREEMGVDVMIVGELDGWWLGETTATKVFVTEPAGPLDRHGPETASVCWATIDEARELVALSPSAIVRSRDLAVLGALEPSPP